jgi:hypothetical protein
MKKLFVIKITARPRENTPAFREFGGAHVVAWIDAPSEHLALERAQREVRESGWMVERVDAVALLQRSDYEEDDPSVEYFDQALIDKEVLVFHAWPVEPQEGDPVH